MIQTVDVVAIFDRMIREPKPVRFKIYDSGHWKSVNVERILNIEWMRLDGKVRGLHARAFPDLFGRQLVRAEVAHAWLGCAFLPLCHFAAGP